jgi:hypothetical protein
MIYGACGAIFGYILTGHHWFAILVLPYFTKVFIQKYDWKHIRRVNPKE